MQFKKVNLNGMNTYKLPILSGGRMKELVDKMPLRGQGVQQELINGTTPNYLRLKKRETSIIINTVSAGGKCDNYT